MQASYKMLADEDKMKHVREVIGEAKEKLKAMMDAARAKTKGGAEIAEDNPVVYAASLRRETLRLFADYEKRREDLAAQDARIRCGVACDLFLLRESGRMIQFCRRMPADN